MPDGSIIFSDDNKARIRRVGTDGIIETLAGVGDVSGIYPDNNVDATKARLGSISDIITTRDGDIYFTTNSYYNLRRKVRKITPERKIFVVAGGGQKSIINETDTVKAAEMRFSSVASLERGYKGQIFVVDNSSDVIYRIDTDGVVRYHSDTKIGNEHHLSDNADVIRKAPNGKLYFIQSSQSKIVALNNNAKIINKNSHLVASEDGSQLFEFNEIGKHLRTIDPLTNKNIYKFSYNDNNLLEKIIDINNNETKLIYNSQNRLTKIIGPKGVETKITVNPDSNLVKIEKPGNENVTFEYYDKSLMKSITDARGYSSKFYYNDLGKLIKDEDAAGGYKTLKRKNFSDGYEITYSTANGQVKKYIHIDNNNNEIIRIETDASGLKTYNTKINNNTKIISKDKTVLEYKLVKHPRFGSRAPIMKNFSITTPSGLKMGGKNEKIITKMDGFVVKGEKDEITINGKKIVKEYDGILNKITHTSPENRKTVSEIDTIGRVVKTTVAGVYPVTYKYDLQGRVASVKQGSRQTSIPITQKDS